METVTRLVGGNFYKVSKETWMKSMPSIFNPDDNDDIKVSAEKKELREKYEKSYDDIILPSRATSGSAGYDFFLPFSEITLGPNDSVIIPTGIKCAMHKGVVLQLYPRSSHGIKHRIILSNTVGIIDSDYFNNEDNEGHIMVALHNNWDLAGVPLVQVVHPITQERTVTIDTDSEIFKSRVFSISPGTAFCQGIFIQYAVADCDRIRSDERIGGIGSTDTSSKSLEK